MTEPTPPAAPVPPPAASQPAPGQPVYGQPAYGYAPYAQRTNTLAIIALILGFVVPLGGIICGHIALGQIRRTGEDGRGLALAGTILGYVFTGLTVLVVIAYIIFFVVIFAAAGAGAYHTY